MENKSLNNVKGFKVNNYGSFTIYTLLNYNLLSLSEYECELCQENMYGSSLQIVSHYSKCMKKQDDKNEEIDHQEERKRDPNAQEFDCKECGKILYLTSTEILRHKKSHQ